MSAGDFDVELVPVGGVLSPAAPAPKKHRSRGRGVRRRNFILLGLGALGVLAAIVIGGAIASGGFTPFLQKIGLVAPDEANP